MLLKFCLFQNTTELFYSHLTPNVQFQPQRSAHGNTAMSFWGFPLSFEAVLRSNKVEYSIISDHRVVLQDTNICPTDRNVWAV
jgi:hypothetical protein